MVALQVSADTEAHSTLVPTALELYNPMAYDGNVAYAPFCFLLSHCITTLENLTREAPTWSLRANLICKCSCELCGELKIFLKDPGKCVSRVKTSVVQLSDQVVVVEHTCLL